MHVIPSIGDVLAILDTSIPKLLLGNKSHNPNDWRWISDVMDGKRTNPHRRKVEQVFATYSEQAIELEQFEDATGWETFCGGLQSNGSAPYPATFCHEAIRMEKMALQVLNEYNRHGRVTTSLTDWDFLDIPSFHAAMLTPHDRNNVEPFIETIRIINSLYLLACWEVDEVGDTDSWLVDRLLPIRRAGKPVLPMRLWMEAMRTSHSDMRLVDLYDCLLVRRSKKEDVETLRRVARKWWQKGEIPAWSLVPRIIESLNTAPLSTLKGVSEFGIYASLAIVRILDHLLSSSVTISERYKTWTDPLAPFNDYPTLHSLAQSRATKL